MVTPALCLSLCALLPKPLAAWPHLLIRPAFPVRRCIEPYPTAGIPGWTHWPPSWPRLDCASRCNRRGSIVAAVPRDDRPPHDVLRRLSPTTDPPSLDRLFDFGHPPFGGKLLKLQWVVTRYDAIGRARELNHPLLLLEIRWNVRFAECRTGFMVPRNWRPVRCVRCRSV